MAIVRAVLTGLLVGAVVTYPWSFLVTANIQHMTGVPWAVLPTAVYVGIWWRYVSGSGWPASTSLTRRTALRASRVAEEQWGPALLAGILGIATSLALLNLTNRWLPAPQQAVSTSSLSNIPPFTVLTLSLTGAAIAGIAEEAAFRGYMQGAIERRHGPATAILVTAVVFGLAHYGHPGLLVMMPFYMAVGTTYGLLAYLTGSILPGMLLHAASDALGSVITLAQGSSTSSLPLPAIQSQRPTWWLIARLVGTAVAAAWAYRMLAVAATRPAPGFHEEPC